MKIIYQAIDGRQFETRKECIVYEYSRLRFNLLYFDGQKIVKDKDSVRFMDCDNPIAAQIEEAIAIEFKNKKSYNDIKKYCDAEGIEFPEYYGSGVWVWNEIEWVDAKNIDRHPEFGLREINAWKEYMSR